jgi:hypothetical protein
MCHRKVSGIDAGLIPRLARRSATGNAGLNQPPVIPLADENHN